MKYKLSRGGYDLHISVTKKYIKSRDSCPKIVLHENKKKLYELGHRNRLFFNGTSSSTLSFLLYLTHKVPKQRNKPKNAKKNVRSSSKYLLNYFLNFCQISMWVDDDGAQLTTRDLDECHGKWHGSEYRYHVTADYPYFINCFRGRVPAQNKNTLVRRGRRETSYSWRQAARMPTVHKAVIFPLKMNECKICSSIKSCRSNNYGNSWTRPSQPMPRYR
jgi:hypothetical protein